MAVQLPSGKNYFATATGAPGVGYRLYAFVPGTSTPKDTYTTSAATVTNTHPVVMDARGEAAIYWGGAYDVVLRDAADALIWGPERLEQPEAAGAAADVLADLADTASASEGDRLIGGKRTAIAAVASTLHNWIEGTVISAAEAGILPANSSATNTTLINALIVASPGRRIYFPGYAGTYEFGDIDMTTGTHYWFGDGVEGTRFEYTGSGTFINAEKAADEFLPRSPIYIEGIGCFCATKSTQVGVSIENRHNWVLRNCTFDSFGTILKLNMAYLGLVENVHGTDCNTGWDIVGDCNAVAFRSSGVTDFDTYGVRIRGGTFGCIALEFDNCDLEFASGVAVRCETDDLIDFTNCYLGDGVTANVFEITSGKLRVNGGLVQWGSQSGFTNRLVEFVGANPTTDERSLTIERTKMSGGTYCGPDAEKMVKGDGKLYIHDSGIGTVPAWSGAAVVIAGQPLGKAPGFNALLSPFGRTFTGNKCDNTFVPGTGTITFTDVADLTTGSRLLTCTGAGAATDVLYTASTLQVGELQTFGAAGVIIVYASNSAWGVNLSSGAFNTAPAVSLGGSILANTSGAISTCVVQGQSALAAAYTTLELFRQNPANADYLNVYRVYLFDERQYGAGGTLYAGKNLYEPI